MNYQKDQVNVCVAVVIFVVEYDKNYYKKDKIFDVFEEFRRKRF